MEGEKLKLLKCTVEKLNRMSKKKKLICFGAGGNMYEFFRKYKDFSFEKKAAYILDNDSNKIGTFVEVNGTKIPVESPELIKNVNLSDYVIVIMTVRYEEIFSQIQNLVFNKRGKCYLTPFKRYEFEKIVEKIIKILPMKKFVVLYGNANTNENALALGKYLIRNNDLYKYKVIWMCDDYMLKEDKRNEKHICTSISSYTSKKDTLKYYFYLGRAKYIFYENQIVKKLRKDQISVYMNHGSPPIKATKGKIVLPSELNYCVCPSENVADIVSEQYSVNKQRMVYCGAPRTDCMYDGVINKRLNQRYDCKQYKKVVLWLPTFRKLNNRIDSNVNYKYGIPIIKNDGDILDLSNCLKRLNILLLVKPHPLHMDTGIMKIRTENIDVISNEEMAEMGIGSCELLKFADAMITDYSTVAFDFMLLNRMIGYTVDDMEQYSLGFSVKNPLDYMPGEKIKGIDELIEFIRNVDMENDVYCQERNKINKMINVYKGDNCKRLIDLLNM